MKIHAIDLSKVVLDDPNFYEWDEVLNIIVLGETSTQYKTRKGFLEFINLRRIITRDQLNLITFLSDLNEQLLIDDVPEEERIQLLGVRFARVFRNLLAQ